MKNIKEIKITINNGEGEYFSETFYVKTNERFDYIFNLIKEHFSETFSTKEKFVEQIRKHLKLK